MHLFLRLCLLKEGRCIYPSARALGWQKEVTFFLQTFVGWLFVVDLGKSKQVGSDVSLLCATNTESHLALPQMWQQKP